MMKKFFHFFSIIALMAMSASCSSDEPAATNTGNNVETDANFLSVDDALINARKAFKVMLGKDKSCTRADVDAEMFIPASKTRGNGESLYGYYVINYGNGDGFALVSADKRRAPVLALSGEGSMHLSDTTSIPGLSWYLNDHLADMDVAGSVHIPTFPRDSTIQIYDPYLDGKRVDYCDPLITGFRSKFHQQWPYNKYCFTKDKKQALVGCGPLALGTIVSYYKYPNTIEGYQMNWNEMYQQYHDSWRRLFEILGRPQYLNADYREDATGVHPELCFVNAVQKLGYSDGKYIEFSTYDAENQLKMKRPLFMVGYRDISVNKRVGHAWVVDGGYEFAYRLATQDDPKHIQYDYYYHVIWGWGGSANGYFLYTNSSYTNSSGKLGGDPNKRDEGTSGSANKYDDLHIGIGHAPNH